MQRQCENLVKEKPTKEVKIERSEDWRRAKGSGGILNPRGTHFSALITICLPLLLVFLVKLLNPNVTIASVFEKF